MRYLLIRRHPDGTEERSDWDASEVFVAVGLEIRTQGSDEVWVVVEAPHDDPRERLPVVVAEPKPD